MKQIIFPALLFLISVKVNSQANISEESRLASLCKIWGFLKYYHEAAAQGNIDWDKQLIERIPAVLAATDKISISEIYINWIRSLGDMKQCNNCQSLRDDLISSNYDMKWQKDSLIFSDSLISLISLIGKNKIKAANYFVKQSMGGIPSFTNENPYPTFLYPQENYRLVGLFRYWNIVNYFYPYKSLMDQQWDNVLTSMIPKFRSAKDTTAYNLCILELTAKLNDSHSSFITAFTLRYFGNYWVPFIYKIINNKAIVTGFYNDSLAASNDVKYGDVVITVEGKTIDEIIKANRKYIAASNEGAFLRDLFYVIFNGHTDSVNISYERNGVVSQKTIRRYRLKTLNINFTDISQKSTLAYLNDMDFAWRRIDSVIGYVNLGKLESSQVNKSMSELWNTKAIILDIRNNPNGNIFIPICKKIYNEKTNFLRYIEPYLNVPGMFKYGAYAFCGGNNRDYYKGKIILLINEMTQSHAEFTCMALQTAPNVVCIGSQTGGTNGIVVKVVFPGDYETLMTGVGVCYYDGKVIQRKGIIPDVIVNPTIEGIRNKKDEVLERAVEYVHSDAKKS